MFRNPTFVGRDLILFDISGDSAGNGLAAFSLKSGQITRLGIAGAKPILVNGHILVYFSADGTIWAVEFNTRSLQGSGPARRIGVGVSMSAFGVPRAAIAPNGTIVYAVSAEIDRRELVLVDRTGAARDIGGGLRAYRFPRFSPNGQQVAVTVESTGGVASGDIWVLGLDGRAPLRLTADSSSYQAEWDPDGQSLIYAHRQPSAFSLYRIAADGSGAPPAEILTRPYQIPESRITPDHRTIVWREDNPKTLRDIMSAPLDSVSNIHPIVATPFDERGISMSPDGRWLAYVTTETGIDQVFIRRLAPQSPRWPVSRSGGTEPRWSKTGELFFRRGDSVFVSRVSEGDVPQISVPVGLFSGRYAATSNEAVWDVSPDGRQFAMVRIAGSESLRLTLFMNWAERWSARPQ